MIVLDTNVLERHPFESPVMAILKVLSRLTNHKLAISEVTLNERCSHFRNQLQRGFEQQASAVAGYVCPARAFPSDADPPDWPGDRTAAGPRDR